MFPLVCHRKHSLLVLAGTFCSIMSANTTFNVVNTQSEKSLFREVLHAFLSSNFPSFRFTYPPSRRWLRGAVQLSGCAGRCVSVGVENDTNMLQHMPLTLFSYTDSTNLLLLLSEVQCWHSPVNLPLQRVVGVAEYKHRYQLGVYGTLLPLSSASLPLVIFFRSLAAAETDSASAGEWWELGLGSGPQGPHE